MSSAGFAAPAELRPLRLRADAAALGLALALSLPVMLAVPAAALAGAGCAIFLLARPRARLPRRVISGAGGGWRLEWGAGRHDPGRLVAAWVLPGGGALGLCWRLPNGDRVQALCLAPRGCGERRSHWRRVLVRLRFPPA